MTASAIIDETSRAQRSAADPSASVFVSANAGAGKTRVLTERVARLLLAGVDPSTILCITFTKAAAAEMAHRLFALLGGWALADDASLASSLSKLVGVDVGAADQQALAAARRLFARALETPGGLKIQTIHSFCEHVLKRFPLEAGVAPGFTVIEERDAAALAAAAVDKVAADAEGRAAAAFAHLLAKLDGRTLRDLIAGAIASRRRFRRAFEIGWDAFADEAAATLGATRSPDAIVAEIVRRVSSFDLARLRSLLLAGNDTTRKAAPAIDAFIVAGSDAAKLDAVKPVFLTAKDEPRRHVIAQGLARENPEFAAEIENLQTAIVERLGRLWSAQALEDASALYTILASAFAAYEAEKTARAALDFDDLIEKARALMGDQSAAQWVLYKLDQGLAHILLDEAQDTSPEAWEVIERPLSEFFAGDGARAAARTFFAVGDQKQSIYSFQGADAALFKAKEADLGKKFAAAGDYRNILLAASFRSTAPVLEFVDALFARAEVLENVSADAPLIHHCTRLGEAGLVELWPLVPRAEPSKLRPWDAPLDLQNKDDTNKQLASEVAATIASWLRSGETLASQGRPIEPGDILILVQSRSALFYEVIRALAGAGVPVAGADKLKLTEDQAVLDLISYARAALFEGDDLSLAETLKSPFFDVDEESLYDLAAPREKATIWSALQARKIERPAWMRAAAEIEASRLVALNEGPVAFFNYILETGAPSGWKRLAARLGPPAREPVEEFLRLALEFENRSPRSLRLFLDEICRAEAEVSREISEASGSVRVMTVHKAKGLEANIVFMLDAHKGPNKNTQETLFELEGPAGDLFPAPGIGQGKRAPPIALGVERAKRLRRDEYRRLLYVAATRARDRLYICGVEPGGGRDPHKPEPADKTWHALAEDAFDLLPETVLIGEKFGAPVRRLEVIQTVDIKRAETRTAAIADTPPADYLRQPARKEARTERRSPSSLADFIERESWPDAAYSPSRGEDPFLRGTVLHRLLQLIPDVAPVERRARVMALAARLAPTFSSAAVSALAEEALAVIEHPQFAPVFGPGSLAEVAIGGWPKGARADIFLSGAIDRLVVLEDRILIVDYKTNRPPPQRIEDAPMAYIAQLAAYRALLQETYPGRKVEAALLWTHDARLAPAPADALDHAFSVTLA